MYDRYEKKNNKWSNENTSKRQAEMEKDAISDEKAKTEPRRRTRQNHENNKSGELTEEERKRHEEKEKNKFEKQV